MGANISTTAQPCADCRALDGQDSSVAPHDWLALGIAVETQPDDPSAGTIEYYLCRMCRMRLQRFNRTCILDGWLVMRSQVTRLPTNKR